MRVYLSIIVVALLCSCSSGALRPARPITTCPPPPPPECKPQAWTGVPFDTSSTKGFAPNTYWKIEKVAGADGAINEYGVAFRTKNAAFLTTGNDSTQTIQNFSFKNVHEGSIGDAVRLRTQGQAGTPSLRSNTLLYTSYPYGNFLSDADLYEGTLEGNASSIQQAQRSTLSTEISWDGHPALSPDGNTLFFSSEREGGKGGTDIWISRKLPNGKWSEPVNAGDNINTPCDELSPFITLDGKTLLFASAGHETLGGYDIFSTPLANALYTSTVSNAPAHIGKAVNIGAPLNTTADELFPSTPTTTDELLYYSSNQTPQTGFDTYVRHRLPYPQRSVAKKNPVVKEETIQEEEPKEDTPPITKKERPEKKVPLTGTVYNSHKERVRNADVKVRDADGMEIIAETTTDENGNYTVMVPSEHELEVTAQYEEGFYDSYRVKVPSTNTPYKRDFVVPEVLSLRINFPNDEFQAPYKNVLDSNGVETNQAWVEQLNLLADNLKKSKDRIKKVLLVGHTDENGTNDYNQALGQRRVDFVVNELVKRGLPKSMFETRSAGEMEPLARRKSEPLETYYKRNRRVELSKIMR